MQWLLDDMSIPDRWLLADLQRDDGYEFEGWEFTNPLETLVSSFDFTYETTPTSVGIYHPGNPLDYCVVEGGGPPIVSEKAADLFRNKTDAVLLPVRIRSAERLGTWFVVWIPRAIDCLDVSTTHFGGTNDHLPDAMGQHLGIVTPSVRMGSLVGVNLCRIASAFDIVLASDEFASEAESLGLTGMRFRTVRTET